MILSYLIVDFLYFEFEQEIVRIRNDKLSKNISKFNIEDLNELDKLSWLNTYDIDKILDLKFINKSNTSILNKCNNPETLLTIQREFKNKKCNINKYTREEVISKYFTITNKLLGIVEIKSYLPKKKILNSHDNCSINNEIFIKIEKLLINKFKEYNFSTKCTDGIIEIDLHDINATDLTTYCEKYLNIDSDDIDIYNNKCLISLDTKPLNSLRQLTNQSEIPSPNN